MSSIRFKGTVNVNFTKAVQQATLDSGFYDGISIDVKGLYNIGYMEGIQDSDTVISYSTMVINPGKHGKFTIDGTTSSKTFTGPSYTGFTMDVTPIGSYRLAGWDTTIDSTGTITMTAHWIVDETVSTTIYNFNSGEYYFGKDYVTSITLSAYNNSTKSTSNNLGGYWTADPNQISNETRSVTASASYDLYVNGEYWKTISCSDTFTGYGTKSKVSTAVLMGTMHYAYNYSWSASATTTITFDEPVQYLAIVEKSTSRTADVTIERYIDE